MKTSKWEVTDKKEIKGAVVAPHLFLGFPGGKTWSYKLKNPDTGETKDLNSDNDYAIGDIISENEINKEK